MINRVILIGNLGREAEFKALESGTEVAKFSIATSDAYKDKDGEWQEKTEWHNIVAWAALAKKAGTLEKGATIYLEGKLTHRDWEDPDGHKKYFTEVVASYFRVIKKSGGGSSNGDAGKKDTGYFPQEEPAGAAPKMAGHKTGAVGDDGLPF
mgnify:CR=1 FL=1